MVLVITHTNRQTWHCESKDEFVIRIGTREVIGLGGTTGHASVPLHSISLDTPANNERFTKILQLRVESRRVAEMVVAVLDNGVLGHRSRVVLYVGQASNMGRSISSTSTFVVSLIAVLCCCSPSACVA